MNEHWTLETAVASRTKDQIELPLDRCLGLDELDLCGDDCFCVFETKHHFVLYTAIHHHADTKSAQLLPTGLEDGEEEESALLPSHKP